MQGVCQARQRAPVDTVGGANGHATTVDIDHLAIGVTNTEIERLQSAIAKGVLEIEPGLNVAVPASRWGHEEYVDQELFRVAGEIGAAGRPVDIFSATLVADSSGNKLTGAQIRAPEG